MYLNFKIRQKSVSSIRNLITRCGRLKSISKPINQYHHLDFYFSKPDVRKSNLSKSSLDNLQLGRGFTFPKVLSM